MTPLERRYRRVLRILPADYRAQWEDDMVDTFLLTREPPQDLDDDFDADFGRPSWTEVASVLGLATRLRLGGTAASPKSFARGEVVRRVALAGLLAHAVAAIVGVLSLLITQSRFPEYRVSDLDTVWVLTGLLWVGAYLVLLADHRRAAVWLGAAALVPVLLDSATDVWIGGTSIEVAIYRLLLAALPVLALAAFHHEAPPVRPRPWLIALPVGTAAVMAVALATQIPTGVVALDWSGVLCLATIIASAGLLITGHRGPWTGAMPILATALLGERLLTILDYTRYATPDPETTVLIIAGVLQAATLILVTTPLILRRRQLQLLST